MYRYLILAVFSILFTTSSFSQVDSSAWPKEITAGSFLIKVYSPENASYIDLRLKSNSAVSVRKKEEEGKPIFGMIWTTSLLDVDRESRMAGLVSIQVDEVRFPDNVSEEQKRVLKEVLESEIPKFNFEIPLDILLDSMETVSTYNTPLKSDPPQVLFANEPTVLVFIDGEPKFKKVDDSYSAIENSAYFIFEELKTKTYYLKGSDFWYTSNDPLSNWKSTTTVPENLEAIYAKTASNEVENDTEEDNYDGTPPSIVVATVPSELINIKGETKFSPIQNTNLLFVENTESNVFMQIDEQNYYLLISGRWYISKELKNDWKYISSDQLPEDFKKIGKESPKAVVLANVAGTEEAEDAVYDAQIPQTAEVKKDKQLEQEVKYNGEPEFQKIKGLELEYALNTESSVLKDGDDYFLCDNAIWYTSKSPKGPWKVSEERPDEVDDIPAENPQYKTKYVYIYETSPTVVYVGYTPGYYGSYVYGPTVVYGTGYYYNPWYGGYYYHHPYSYGMSMSYNSMYGWSIGFSFGSPYGWYGHAYYGRSYYRPPYYRGGYHRHPAHYRNTYRTQNGVNRYQRPNTSNRPNRPTNGGGNVNRPGGRPSTQPSTRPSRPSTQPSTRPSRPSTQPSTRPSNPSSRPSTQPSTRPSNPTSRPSTQPSTRPSTRPSNNYSRPTTRPSAPMSRPSPRSYGGGRRR